MSRITGLILVALGFVLSVLDAYVDGFEEGEKAMSAAAVGLPHLHSIHERTLVAFCAGVLIFVVGYVLILLKQNVGGHNNVFW